MVPGHLWPGGTWESHSVTSVLVEELTVGVVVGETVVDCVVVVEGVVVVVLVVVELQCSSSTQGRSPQSTSSG